MSPSEMRAEHARMYEASDRERLIADLYEEIAQAEADIFAARNASDKDFYTGVRHGMFGGGWKR